MAEILGYTNLAGEGYRKTPHKRLTFIVTAEDIANGHIKSNGGACPVELAIKRNFGYWSSIGITCFHIFGTEDWYRGQIDDRKLSKFITDFDNYKDVKPGEFWIEVPEELK